MDRTNNIFLVESPDMGRTVHTFRRKSIHGPQGPYLRAPYCLGRLGEKHIFGTSCFNSVHPEVNWFARLDWGGGPYTTYDGKPLSEPRQRRRRRC